MTGDPRAPKGPWDDGAPMPDDDDFALAPDWDEAPFPEEVPAVPPGPPIDGAPTAPAPGGSVAGPRPPTDKQLAFARKLASERGLEIPDDALASSAACSHYIDGLLAKPAPGRSARGAGGAAGRTPAGGSRPPTDKQLAFAKRLAREKGLSLTDADLADSRAVSHFIDRALGKA